MGIKRRSESIEVDPRYLQHLKIKDYLQGLDDEHEIEIARRYNILKWTPAHNRWAKESGRKRVRVCKDFK